MPSCRVVQVASIKTRIERTYYGVCNQRLELGCHNMFSTFAFQVNVRRYMLALARAARRQEPTLVHFLSST